ncbi:hypothetical protein EIN_060380 [Entamoeba invadens IP1]|uniref:hypothetical protein n=1 Tax=Entamoeba invadens IP1 TaxID=370355 RepID=UPI0002C3FA04|nr:hypothetical protein EIN_060380 [Entamoeba invadens IP1]ELP93513.1 hypothetical protein EIN_060380 [Entamoeba invadens IP1]|eukprot:XP_004260284.1 hypothetical protein EIN_060380 [Entamoeba invadens IP1]
MSVPRVLQCVCGNIKVSLETSCEYSEVPLDLKKSIPTTWVSPLCGSLSQIYVEYEDMKKSTKQADTLCLSVRCLLCETNVCVTLYTSNLNCVVINPDLISVDNLRQNLTYSKTFGLWIKNIQVDQNTTSFVTNTPLERLLALRKQSVIDYLFEEKERVVREFVQKQEELFEEKRREVKSEFLMLKTQCFKQKIEGNEDSLNVGNNLNKYDEVMRISDEWKRNGGVFRFEEDEGRLFENCSAKYKKFAEKKKEEGEEKTFPSTFKEYVLEKLVDDNKKSGVSPESGPK